MDSVCNDDCVSHHRGRLSTGAAGILEDVCPTPPVPDAERCVSDAVAADWPRALDSPSAGYASTAASL